MTRARLIIVAVREARSGEEHLAYQGCVSWLLRDRWSATGVVCEQATKVPLMELQ
jgi:hypothetical protein